MIQRAEGGIRPIDVDLQIHGDLGGCGPTLEVSIYRMVQECMTNAQRHCDAPHMRIVIDAQGSMSDAGCWVQIDAVNDGLPDPPRTSALRGLGTLGMRERSIALGGSFEAGPAKAVGVCASVCRSKPVSRRKPDDCHADTCPDRRRPCGRAVRLCALSRRGGRFPGRGRSGHGGGRIRALHARAT